MQKCHTSANLIYSKTLIIPIEPIELRTMANKHLKMPLYIFFNIFSKNVCHAQFLPSGMKMRSNLLDTFAWFFMALHFGPGARASLVLSINI